MSRFAVAAALILAAALQIHRLDDPDTWWHLATGRTIWATGAIPRADPFSFTAPGAPWTNLQWLFDYTLYGSWLLAGPAGPTLLTCAAFLVAFASQARLLARRLPGWAVAAVVVLGTLAAVERFTPRPEAFSCAFLGLGLLLVDGPLSRGRATLLVLLQVLWANCHALSVLGLIPIGAAWFAALPAVVPRLRAAGMTTDRTPVEARRLGFVLVGAVAAQFATPFGIEGALFPLRLLAPISGQEQLSFTIVEHRATSLAELSPVAGAALVTLLALAALGLALAWRRLRLEHLLVGVAFTVLAAMARRNVALLGFGLAPLLATTFEAPLKRLDGWLRPRRGDAWMSLAVALVALGLTAQVVRGGFYDRAHLTRTFGLGEAWHWFSSPAVTFLQQAAPGTRVLNDDVLGGYLIWRGLPVFFDGRLQVYPEAVYAEWQRVLDDPTAFPAVVARWNIGAVALHHPSPGRLELTRAVANVPGWRIAYLDGGVVVLLGDSAPATDPRGIRTPVQAFDTPGLSGWVEALVAPLRRADERTTAYYERGRAVLYLWGAPVVPAVREDFRAALAIDPSNREATEGLRAIDSIR